MKKRYFWWGLVSIVLAIAGQSITAIASTKEDVSLALKTAPQGIEIDDYFQRGEIANNSAKLAQTDFGPNQAVQLTDATTGGNELGTIWTSDAAKMDLGENQTASMWLYTGNQISSGGDGMTFTMQNDERGIKASALNTADPSNPIPATGETLGVWGDDVGNKFLTAEDLAKTGIQNSWALEFDTFSNKNFPATSSSQSTEDQNSAWATFFQNSANAANQFDADVSGIHIASGYPGNQESYNVMTKKFSWKSYSGIFDFNGTEHATSYPYAVLNHQGVLTNGYKMLSTGTWKHLTLKWRAATSQMTYTFDDKDPKTGAAQKGQTAVVTVDQSKLGMEDDQKIRWGFTGSTGASFENNLVVFEQVPGLVDAAASAQLIDSTQSNRAITATNNTVNSGDRLKLRYNLAYNGGRESWKAIQAKMQLPTNVVFNSATIDYANGDRQTISDLSGGSQGSVITAQLQNELSKNNPTATITFQGKAIAATTGDATVSATNSTFAGANAITQAGVPSFTVKKTDDATMSLVLTGQNVVSGSGSTLAELLQTQVADVAVTGKVNYVTGTADTNNNLVLHPVLNGEEQQPVPLSNDDPAGTFTYKLAADKIISGQANVLTIYATDSKGHASNDVSYTITRSAGSRELVAAPASSFNVANPVQMSGTEMTLSPDNDWNVTVNDTKGKGDQWILTAQATPFVSKLRGSLSADLTYVASDGTTSSLENGATTILTHTTSTDNDVVNVTDDWNSDSGVFLRVHSDAIQGRYYSNITWTLTDGPQ